LAKKRHSSLVEARCPRAEKGHIDERGRLLVKEEKAKKPHQYDEREGNKRSWKWASTACKMGKECLNQVHFENRHTDNRKR